MISRTFCRGALLALPALIAASSGCRKKQVEPPTPAAQPSSGPTAAASAAGAGLRAEKFVAARARGADIELAAVARDRSVVLATLDATLRPRNVEVLARDVEAAEGTEISLVADGLVLFVGKLGGSPGAWLLRKGAAPTLVARDRCAVRDGVAWLQREGASVHLRLVQASGESKSPAVTVPAEREVHLACGRDAVVLATRDGEHLSLATFGVDTFSAPASLVEVEREGELDDELRDRLILPRAGKSVVLLRVGESSVSVRELDDKGSGAWRKAMRDGKPVALREDADLVAGAVAPDAQGKIWFLASEPTSGGACADGEPPRRIVLHELETKGANVVDATRPVIELPCGIEAIDAHLAAEATRATMWWTEPVDKKACPHPGLSASAVVVAASDRPGARRTAIVAEGVTPIDPARFLAVTRPGGCAPWSAPEAGALMLVPAPR
ncbi:MAG: hypothetical protein HYV09_33930 [Deltaproteobacteria bacterium]|nr:hypothetical protein [Deltaproteobacteria bacterium]